MRVYERRGESVSSGWFTVSLKQNVIFFFPPPNPKGHSGYFISQFIRNQVNSTFFMSLLNNNRGLCYIFIPFIAQCLHVLIGSVWEQGNVITVVVFFHDSGTTCLQQDSPLSPCDSCCEAVHLHNSEVRGFVLWKNNRRETGGVKSNGFEWPKEVCVCVCEASKKLPPSSLAIAALLVAFCPLSGPGRSSGSRSGVAVDVHALAPSTGLHPARHHCLGQSPSAWGQRRWEQGRVLSELYVRSKRREEKR